LLTDGRRAFLKGIWRESNDHMRRAIAIEERVYRELGDRLAPYAPSFIGAFQRDDWHVLLLEDCGPADVPPWTPSKAQAAAREYAAFHERNVGYDPPEWVSRTDWQQFGEIWSRLAALDGGIPSAARLAGERADEAEAWLRGNLATLDAAARAIASAPRPFTLLHEDTRADNVRLHGGKLRLFDWNWISLGPAEFDVAGFAEGIAADGGPPPETFVDEYERVRPVRRDVLRDVVAGAAAYFSAVAWRPPPPGLPRVRDVQRRQMKVCVPWAARLLGLPQPDWIEAVPP
jgi:Ser/Thr protein kinase RdoA (MazF antagonist)